MRKFYEKSIFILVLVISIFLFGYFNYINFSFSYIGLTVEQNESGDTEITKVDEIGWGNQQGIQPGDIVLLVNHNTPSEKETIRKYNVIEKVQSLNLIRNGKHMDYSVSNNLPLIQMIYQIIIPSLFFIICFTLSIFLYKKNKNDQSTNILIFFLLILGLSYLGSNASGRTDILAKLIVTPAFLFIPILFLLFLQSYFKKLDIAIIKGKTLSALIWLNSILALNEGMAIFINLGPAYNYIRVSYLLAFSLDIIYCLYVLISGYIKYRKTIHKPIFKILIVAMLLSFFPFIGFVGIPKILIGDQLISTPIASIFLIFLPISFTYLVLTNRLFDIDFIIGRVRYYAVLSLFPTIVIPLILAYVIRIELSLVQWMQTILTLYIGIILFLYLKENLDYKIRARLFPERYQFQASLDRFTQVISKVMKISEMEHKIVAEVKEVLQIPSVAVLEWDKELDVISNQLNGIKNFPAIGELLQTDDGSCLIIGSTTQKLYILWFGEKRNRTELNQEELAWLKTIAHYTSIMYENLNTIEDLIMKLEMEVKNRKHSTPWVSRLLFRLSEKERRILAADLHDTAMQDQIYWYQRLVSILNEQKLSREVRMELDEIKEGLLDVMVQIRETCHDLRPQFLTEIGLVPALKELFKKVHLRYDFSVYFDSKDFRFKLSKEIELTVYRIVQELLHNAVKHSKATEISILLSSNWDSVYLSYRDNGVGIDMNNLKFSFNHMGLSGIQERVWSLEGNIEFQSTKGKGLAIFIQMPVLNTYSIRENIV